MAFLTTSTITLSCLASAPLQPESWWLGHVVPDVVFADIGGHALDIFLHGLWSAHKNGIVKTFTHTSIPIHPCTLLKNEKEKERAKRSTDQTWCLRLLVLFLSTVVLGDGQEARHLLLRTAPRRTPSRLGQYWQNICRCVQQIFATSPGNNPLSNNLHNNLFLPGFSSSPGWLLATRTRGVWWCRYRGHCRSDLDIFLHGPESARKNGIVKTFTHTSIPINLCTTVAWSSLQLFFLLPPLFFFFLILFPFFFFGCRRFLLGVFFFFFFFFCNFLNFLLFFYFSFCFLCWVCMFFKTYAPQSHEVLYSCFFSSPLFFFF